MCRQGLTQLCAHPAIDTLPQTNYYRRNEEQHSRLPMLLHITTITANMLTRNHFGIWYTRRTDISQGYHRTGNSENTIRLFVCPFGNIAPKQNAPRFNMSFYESHITYSKQDYLRKDIIEIYTIQLQACTICSWSIDWILFRHYCRESEVTIWYWNIFSLTSANEQR